MLRNFASLSALLLLMGSAQAADTYDQVVSRAVAAPNGKIEVLGGYEANSANAGALGWNGGAAFSVPLGDKFGFQADFASTSNFGNALIAGTGHFFTRNPDAYLLGLVGGGVWGSNSNSYFVGPEVEFYAGKVSFEGTAAVMSRNISGTITTDFYGKGTVAYYANPGLRFEAGVKSVAGYNTAHLGAEWQVKEASPLSFTLEGTLGSNGYVGAMAGLKFYFGGEGVSLVDRHRKYDPPITSLNIVSGGSGGAFNVPPAAPPVVTPPCPAFKAPAGGPAAIIPSCVISWD